MKESENGPENQEGQQCVCCLTRDRAGRGRGDGGEVEQGGEKGSLRVAGSAARILVGCTGSEDGKHTSAREEGFSWPQAVILEQLLTEEEGAVESIPGNEGRIAPAWTKFSNQIKCRWVPLNQKGGMCRGMSRPEEKTSGIYLFCVCTRVTSGSSAFLFVFALFDGLCIVSFGPEQDLTMLPWLRTASELWQDRG